MSLLYTVKLIKQAFLFTQGGDVKTIVLLKKSDILNFVMDRVASALENLVRSFRGEKNRTEAKDLTKVKYGAYTLASPHHPSQDVFGNNSVTDANGNFKGLRFFVVDGSGGSSTNGDAVLAKAELIKNEIAARQLLDAKTCLGAVNQMAEIDDNSAYATAVIVDLLPDRIQIARRGDPAVVRFNGEVYSTRRGEGWPTDQRGNASSFQLIDVPQNVAYSLKAANMGTNTRLIDDSVGSSQIYSGVGAGTGEVQSLEIQYSSKEEFLLVMSDGARGGSNLLDPNEPYHRQIKGVMVALKNGAIDETAASKQIANHARAIPGEDDDITVQIVRIPPRYEDPQVALAAHERSARKRGTPAYYDRAHGAKPTRI